MVEYVACMGEMGHAYIIFAGKPIGKRSLRRQEKKWQENIKINLDGVWCRTVD